MAKIYVACLASYNNGCLHGQWFDLDDYVDADDLKADIKEKVLITSPYPNVEVECPDCEGLSDEDNVCKRCNNTGKVPSSEEYAVHDYEDMPSDFGEYPDLEKLIEYNNMQNEHGDAWKAFVNEFGDDVTESDFNEAYVGEYDSEKDFAERWAIDTGMVEAGSPIFSWIDFQQAWDIELQYDFTFENGHVFRRNW